MTSSKIRILKKLIQSQKRYTKIIKIGRILSKFWHILHIQKAQYDAAINVLEEFYKDNSD